jgi:hypothetical protein
MNRPADGTPDAGPRFKHARQRRSAPVASAIGRQVPLPKRIPVPLDQQLPASVAIGALADGVMNIAGVHVAESDSGRDGARLAQRLCRRRRHIQHLVVGVEGSEMQGNVGTEPLQNPSREGLDLLFGVIVAWNEKRGDLEPDVGLVLDEFEGLEHGAELPRAELLIETLGERLEIDIGRVHDAEQFRARLS